MTDDVYTLTPADAAARIGVSERTIRDWYKTGKVDGRYYGSKLLVYWGDRNYKGEPVRGVAVHFESLPTERATP